MQLNATATLIVALIFYFVLPLIILKFVKNRPVQKVLVWVFFVVYLLILIIGVFARVTIKNNIVSITFDYTYGFFNKSISLGFRNLKLIDIGLNLIMLVPVGYVFSFFNSKPLLKKVLYGAVLGVVLGLVIELGQFLLPVNRSVQLSDVLFNTLSVVWGVLIYKIFAPHHSISKTT